MLFVETERMPGKGAIQLTGQLGDVMQARFGVMVGVRVRFGLC